MYSVLILLGKQNKVKGQHSFARCLKDDRVSDVYELKPRIIIVYHANKRTTS